MYSSGKYPSTRREKLEFAAIVIAGLLFLFIGSFA